MPTKQEDIIKLAEKGANDAHLLLFDKLNDLETELENSISELKEKFNTAVQEIKENTPDLNKVLESVKGKDGEDSEIPGIQGEKGDKGDRGEQGLQGYPGIMGVKGERGEKGDNGNDGNNGINGKDGSPDNAEQVRDKLEMVKGEERLDQSAIKGLDEKLEKNQKVIIQRVGGGGSNAWVNQSFSVDSSTTTITLSSPIGAGGLAIFAYYNGQFIVRGTHYTVDSSGTILTLTFTPDNSTTIDVVYLINKKVL
mgnify:CR=1 FL=1